MVILLTRLFGIFAIAGISLFCLLDGLNDIRKGHTAGLPTFQRIMPNTVRADTPVGFWIGVGVKFGCAAAAFLFVVAYFVVLLFSR